MSRTITTRPVRLPLEGFDVLQGEARLERLAFVDRLKAEWDSGKNRFAEPGEILIGAFVGETLVGLCGLNIDPYESDPALGRLRHLFVAKAGRGKGVGSALVNAILEHARGTFRAVRLRTDPDVRGSFYLSLGFKPIVDTNATHEINLEP